MQEPSSLGVIRRLPSTENQSSSHPYYLIASCFYYRFLFPNGLPVPTAPPSISASAAKEIPLFIHLT